MVLYGQRCGKTNEHGIDIYIIYV